MRILWSAALVLVGLGCGGAVDHSDRDERGSQVIAFVAASTQDAVREIAAAFFEQQKTQVKINADDSAKLAMQITQEAPADVFLSANEQWAQFVESKGFVQEAKPLLTNSLVIVVPKGNPAGIKRPEDLLKPNVQRLAIAGPNVPAGIYARQALKNLGLWSKLETDKKVISGDNVRFTLAYVERGETDAGIVYMTDGRLSDKVEIVYTFDQKTHDAIRYTLVLLKTGRQHARAGNFYQFLQSETAKGVFQKHGFTIYDGP
jgi:molybdate transport system substrate-binding protein